jgi:hypothetical protein
MRATQPLVAACSRMQGCPSRTTTLACLPAHLCHGGGPVPSLQRHQGDATQRLLVDGHRGGPAHLPKRRLALRHPACAGRHGYSQSISYVSC